MPATSSPIANALRSLRVLTLGLAIPLAVLPACDDGGPGENTGEPDAAADSAIGADTGEGDTTQPDTDPGDVSTETGTLRGTVTLSDGGSLTGTEVFVGAERTPVAADGTWELVLEPGLVTVVASKSGYTPASQEATVELGVVIDGIDFTLDPLANVAPTIDALTVDPSPLARRGMATATATVTDPDDTELTYEWSADGGFMVVPSAQGTATVTAPEMGLAMGTLTLTVTDASGESATGTVALSTSDNLAPVIDSLTPTETLPVAAGTTFDVAGSASDPDGDPISWSWSIDDPAWTLVEDGDTVTVTAPDAFTASATLTCTVTDDLGGVAMDTLTLTTEGCADPQLIDCDGDASNGCEAPDSGLGPLCPGPASCQEVRIANPAAPDGPYWLTIGGQTAETWCDMTTDGGGWTLLGTISGADADHWNTRFGYWSDANTLGSNAEPWLDFKSAAWNALDLSSSNLMIQRRYDGMVESRVVLTTPCLNGLSPFSAVFNLFDTSVACTPSDMVVLTSSATGVASPTFQEGIGSQGLGSPTTNGLCWGTSDTQINTFSGHLGWNNDPTATTCAIGVHSGGIGVFESSGGVLDSHDITGTSWLAGVDPSLVDIAIFAREPITIIGAATAADPGRWADGTFGDDCLAYKNPATSLDLAYVPNPNLGDGIYTIDSDGPGPNPPTDVFCDMTTHGGGWTALAANGDISVAETDDPADCYPAITNDPAFGCGDPTDVLGDFTLAGDIQGGIRWRRLMAISYGDTGYDDKLAFFATDFGSRQPTTPERIGGTRYTPAGLTTTYGEIYCSNVADIRISQYTLAGTYGVGGIAAGRGTVFGHDSATNMDVTDATSGTRRTYGFTGTSATDSPTNSAFGLDDYQDGYSCGDTWVPPEVRGGRLMVLVR